MTIRTIENSHGASRRRLMIAGSAAAFPWFTGCGGGGGDSETGITADPMPIAGLSLPRVAPSALREGADMKRTLAYSNEAEALLHFAHAPSWAYYTDPTSQRWYISEVGVFTGPRDIYSLGYLVDGEASWWTVGTDAAKASVSTLLLEAANNLDNTTSTKFWDAGRQVWVTDPLIRSDRRLIQGTTVPLKWWFFHAPNGYWYIVADPAYGGRAAPVVYRFGAKDAKYDWKLMDLAGTRVLFEWTGSRPKLRFTPAPGYADAVVGQSIDMDGYYGAQCVDLMHNYIDVALGVPYPHGFTGNAYPIFENAAKTSTLPSRKYGTVTLTKIARSASSSVPLPGDIAFWRNPDPGHVAIVITADATTITSIDQNWFNSSTSGSPAARVNHNNDASVVGWLRPSW